MDLLSLPYDIRFQIYKHIFPPGEQIYVQVLRNTRTLKSITGEPIPTQVFLTCRALSSEASEYLYNNYLFNIIGRKQDCLAAYESFLSIVEKYARNEVHADAFSNGLHSSTMCVSIQSGEAKMPMLKRRARGEWTKIKELEREVWMTTLPPTPRVFQLGNLLHGWWMNVIAVGVLLAAVYYMPLPTTRLGEFRFLQWR